MGVGGGYHGGYHEFQGEPHQGAPKGTPMPPIGNLLPPPLGGLLPLGGPPPFEGPLLPKDPPPPPKGMFPSLGGLLVP